MDNDKYASTPPASPVAPMMDGSLGETRQAETKITESDGSPANEAVLPSAVSKLKEVRMTWSSNDPYTNASAPPSAAGPVMASDRYANATAPPPADPPPAYEAVFSVSESPEIERTSSKKRIYTSPTTLCQKIYGSFACQCILLILAAFPLTSLIIGSLNISFTQCSGSGFIPIWLIVFGAVGLFHTIIYIIKFSAKKIVEKIDERGDKGYQNYITGGGTMCDILLFIFHFGWIIAGSAIVFIFYTTSWSPRDCTNNYDPAQCPCDPVMVLYSFITLILMYIVTILSCCGCCTFLCIASFRKTDHDK